MTFPASESMSAGLFALWLNVTCLIELFLANYLSSTYSHLIMASATAISLLMMLFVREDYKRARFEATGYKELADTPEAALAAVSSDEVIGAAALANTDKMNPLVVTITGSVNAVVVR